MTRILVLQGANLRTLGLREQDVYGTTTAVDIEAMIRACGADCGFEVEVRHLNGEGAAIDLLESVRDGSVAGVIINPGGFVHNAMALRDCLKAFPAPIVEVHLSNIEKRGIRSALTSGVTGIVSGFGVYSYDAAFYLLQRLLKSSAK